MEIRAVRVCTQCRVHWLDGFEPPRCTDPGHEHRCLELHRHESEVVLPDGTAVTAVSYDADDPYARRQTPDHGLYLDRHWRPPWPHEYVDWTDFGVPADPGRLMAALRSTLERARAGQRVEVGCLGGHGRTGTALACLATLTGYPSDDAVEWVRAAYCEKAIETDMQEEFVLNSGSW